MSTNAFPRFFFNIVDGKDRMPHLLIYRQDSEDAPLVPHAAGVPIENKQIGRLIQGKTRQVFSATDMCQAVALAKKHTPKGKVCLLSPGAASFNLFKDYQDRGEQFKYWVKKL